MYGVGGMEPRKWVSNSTSVLENIPSEKRAAEVDLEEGTMPSVKTLGVLWSANDDMFSFQMEEVMQASLTKRSLLSKVAKVFDSLGFVSPFVVRANDSIADDLYRQAKIWLEELEDLKVVKVPRCLYLNSVEGSVTLYTFVDASKVAYGAVCYIRTEHPNGCIKVSMVASKTRVETS